MNVPGYDEDCLTLNVWTPSPDLTAKRPVLVWLHGGGLLFGAGSASWYDGSVLARRGELVVVTVNYRLGALGYLYLPPGVRSDLPVANLGLQDQRLALEWVRDNIARFGGDPDSITVAGQSAGAISIVALHAVPNAKALFHRAILQSGGLSMPARPPAAAEEITQLFAESAGLTGLDLDALLDLPVERVVQAQMGTMMKIAANLGADPRLQPMAMVPFRFVIDGEVLREDHVTAARNGSMNDGDMLLLTTAQEMRFAYAFDEAFWGRDRDSLLPEITRVWGEQGVRLFSEYADAHPEKTAPEVLCDMITDEGSGDTIELAEIRAAAARPVHYAWFSWRSPAAGGRLGACHTAELPFVFGNLSNWSQAPMLAEADQDEVQALADVVQDAWISFITSGDPGLDWPRYAPPECAAMEFGARVGVVNSPVGPGSSLKFLREDASGSGRPSTSPAKG